MSLRGTIRDGHVQLEHASDLPEGTPVNVQPAASESLVELFRRHAIDDPSMPKDFASEVDHYLYGLPKRNDRRTGKPKGGKAGKKPVRRAAKKPRR